MLVVQTNLAKTYQSLGREEDALQMRRDVYSGHLKLHGEEHHHSLLAASNYAGSLFSLQRFEEAKSLLRRTTPVARRILGDSKETTLKMLWIHAEMLCEDDGTTLDDLRELVTTLEDSARGARRVYGSAHPFAKGCEYYLQRLRAVLAARETPGSA